VGIVVRGEYEHRRDDEEIAERGSPALVLEVRMAVESGVAA
jgi:hypothetical protein